MCQRILFLFLNLCFLSFSFGQYSTATGARTLSLSGATVASSDVWSFFTNPAATVKLKHASYSICYENKFLLAAFQQQSLAGAVPLRKGIVQFGVKLDGSSLFRNDLFGVGYGLRLSDKFTIGTNLRVQQLRIQNYGSHLQLFSDVGMYVEMTENLQLGVSILGLGALQKMENVYVSTTVLKSGFSYQPSKKLQLLGEIEKSLMQAIVYKAGVEYKPVESFSLRLGSSLNRRSISFGIGYQLKSVLTVDIGSTWQQVLGWSPHVGILYSFTKDNAN